MIISIHAWFVVVFTAFCSYCLSVVVKWRERGKHIVAVLHVCNSPRPRLQPRVRHFVFVRCAMCVHSFLGSNS